MPRNVEIKARIASIEALLARLGIGARALLRGTCLDLLRTIPR